MLAEQTAATPHVAQNEPLSVGVQPFARLVTDLDYAPVLNRTGLVEVMLARCSQLAQYIGQTSLIGKSSHRGLLQSTDCQHSGQAVLACAAH